MEIELTAENEELVKSVLSTAVRRAGGDKWAASTTLCTLMESLTGWRPAWAKIEGVNLTFYAYISVSAQEYADILIGLGFSDVKTIEYKHPDHWYEVSCCLI